MSVNYLNDVPGLKEALLSGNYSTTDLVKKYGICDRTIRKLRTRLTKPAINCNNINEDQINVSEKNGERNYTIITHKRIRNEKELCDLLELNPVDWTISEFQCKVYEGFFKNRTVQMAQVVQMFSVSCKAKPNKEGSFAKAAIEIITQELVNERQNKPIRIITPPTFTPIVTDQMLELIYADLHLGKFCWNDETGWSNYSLEIAEQIGRNCVDDLFTRNSNLTFEKCLLVFGNDLFHFDTKQPFTTAGTLMDVDSRYQKVFKTAVALIRYTIEKFLHFAPVSVVFVPGNHDSLSSWSAGEVIKAVYENTAHVQVDNSPRLHKYVRHGNTSFILDHGDDKKLKDYPQIMASEIAKVFGETYWHEAHIAHFHKDSVERDEHHGFKIRVAPSMSGTDFWHSRTGKVGNLRSGVSRVYSKELGFREEKLFTLPPCKERIEENALLVY